MGPESFKVYCPGQYKRSPQKMFMYNDGSVSKNVQYKDICTEKFTVNIGYNNEPPSYEIFEVVNNSMVEYDVNIVTGRGYISQDWEILSIFFQNYNLIINWVDCNYTYGVYDDKTGKWTGAVGKVHFDQRLT